MILTLLCFFRKREARHSIGLAGSNISADMVFINLAVWAKVAAL